MQAMRAPLQQRFNAAMAQLRSHTHSDASYSNSRPRSQSQCVHTQITILRFKIHQRLTVPSIVQIVHHINSSPVFVHIDGTEPTARARRAGEEFY